MAVFSLSGDDKGKTLAVIFNDGTTEIISETHISFKALLNAFLEGGADEEHIRELTQVIETTQKKLTELSERVSILGDKILFDGDEINGHLMDVIRDLFASGETIELAPLVKFLEKASTNPSLDSIDDLYRWINNGDLVIDDDGDFIAYKGVYGADGRLSTHSGTAFVDGVEINGQIPYEDGTVVTMPRSSVGDNRNVACSTGLHAGTHRYASGYGDTLILVKINPRDVVSVPNDSSGQKLRVSRLIVLNETTERLSSRYVKTDVVDPDELPETVEDIEEPEEEIDETLFYSDDEFFDPNTDEEQTDLGSRVFTALAAPPVRDPQTGRFLKGGNAPRDPNTGRFLATAEPFTVGRR
jgi:hypothetical protein